MRQERVHHAIALLELHLPGAASRKDRRAHVQRLRRGLVDDLGCSVAEVGGSETWQRVVLGIAVAEATATGIDRVVERIVPMAERDPGVVVTRLEVRRDTLDTDG
ncbi:MAG: DUF503 family protein [Actinomycetota bacterium]|nr:DUF503 family protein [Actinomycetota bacterium]